MAEEWPVAEGEEEWPLEEPWDVESFIAAHGLDDGAASSLRAQSEEVISAVISLGPLSGDNPSAVVMARIRDACPDEVTDAASFLAAVDSVAKARFWAQEEAVQNVVMEEGPLSGNNPSAILMGRIRLASKGQGAADGGTRGSARSGRKAKASQGAGMGEGASTVAVAAPANAAGKAKAVASQATSGQGEALQELAASMCKVNSAMWDFEYQRADLKRLFSEALNARDTAAWAATDPAYWDYWEGSPSEAAAQCAAEPPAKKAKQAAASEASSRGGARGHLPLDDLEQRREAVVAEVQRIVQEAGGSVALQFIGSKELTEMRKGAVGNMSKFLTSRPDIFTVSADGPNGQIMVSLV